MPESLINMKNGLNVFTGLYSLPKTLRFELIPQGETLDHIHQKELLSQDEDRARDYRLVKKIIDRYHQHIIDETLKDFELNDLQEYYELFQSLTKLNAKEAENKLEKARQKLREQIANAFKKNKKFTTLFKKELIKKDLLSWSETTSEDKQLLSKFANFATYFTGFHENRKNIYTSEAHSTAIAYRLIHDNLTMFIDNLHIYQSKMANSSVAQQLQEVLDTLSPGLKLNNFFNLTYFNQTLTQKGIELYNLILGGESTQEQQKLKGFNEIINLHNQQKKQERLPKFKKLYKQILSEKASTSFKLDKIENDSQLAKLINEHHQKVFSSSNDELNTITKLTSLFLHFENFNHDQVYLNTYYLSQLSQQIFGNWSVIKESL